MMMQLEKNKNGHYLIYIAILSDNFGITKIEGAYLTANQGMLSFHHEVENPDNWKSLGNCWENTLKKGSTWYKTYSIIRIYDVRVERPDEIGFEAFQKKINRGR